MWSPASDKPILQTLLFNFSQPPPTTLMYGLIGLVITPKKEKLTRRREREVNPGIKGEESQGEKGEQKKRNYKKKNGKNVMLLGLGPRSQTFQITSM